MIDQYNSLAEKFLRKWFWLYLFSFLIWPIWYLIKIILSNELSVSEIWIIYWVISLISLLVCFNDLWTIESLKHFLPKYIIKKEYSKVKSILFFAFVVQIISSIIIALFFFIWADFIWEYYFKSEEAKWVLKVFSLYFLILWIFRVIEWFFIAIQDTFSHKIIEVIRQFFILFFVLFIFLFWHSSLINFSHAWLFSLFITTIISVLVFYYKYNKKYFQNEKIFFEKEVLIQVTKYSLLVFIWASASTILSQIDMQMIIYMLGTTDAWYYTNYLSIIWIPFLLIWPILTFIFPVVSELHSKKDFQKIELTKVLFSKIFIIIWIMFNLFFFLFSDILAYTIFGEKFLESWIILKYSILFLVFNFLLQINFNIMAWMWNVKDRAKIIWKAIILNIITNIILINLMWVYGASLATWFWWLYIWLSSEYKLWKEYSIKKLDFKPIIKNLIIFIPLWIITYNFFVWQYNIFSRIESFFMLWLAFWVWSFIFLIINFWDFKNIFLEIKKLKKS